MEAGAGDSKCWGKPKLDFLVTDRVAPDGNFRWPCLLGGIPAPATGPAVWVPWPDLENMGPRAQARPGPPGP